MLSSAWKYVPGNEYCVKVTDGTHDSPKQAECGKPLITSKHIKGDVIDFDTAYLISEHDFNEINKRSKVDQWDVIISMIGAYCGFCFIESNEEIEYAVKNVGLFKAGTEVNAKWLYYYLNSPIGRAHLDSVKSGSTQPYIALGALRNLPILVPKEDDVKEKIVAILDAIDTKIRVNNRINAELEAMAKTLYDYWFVQFDFPDANGKPYKTSGGKMVYNPTLKREIPEGWSDGIIADVIGKVPQATKVLAKDFQDNGKVPVIDQSQSYICGFTDDETATIKPESAHVIFGDHTRAVKLVNFDYARGADGTQVLVAKSDKIPSYLLYQIVSDIDLSSYGYARHYKFLKESKCVIPRAEVSQCSQNTVKHWHEKIRDNIFQNYELERLRDWLLPMLMNGQVTVGEAS